MLIQIYFSNRSVVTHCFVTNTKHFRLTHSSLGIAAISWTATMRADVSGLIPLVLSSEFVRYKLVAWSLMSMVPKNGAWLLKS